MALNVSAPSKIEKDYRKIKLVIISLFKGMYYSIPYLFRIMLSLVFAVFIIKGWKIHETILLDGWINIQVISMGFGFYFLFWLFHKTYEVEKAHKKT